MPWHASRSLYMSSPGGNRRCGAFRSAGVLLAFAICATRSPAAAADAGVVEDGGANVMAESAPHSIALVGTKGGVQQHQGGASNLNAGHTRRGGRSSRRKHRSDPQDDDQQNLRPSSKRSPELLWAPAAWPSPVETSNLAALRRDWSNLVRQGLEETLQVLLQPDVEADGRTEALVSAQATAPLGILAVILLISLCWVIELALAARRPAAIATIGSSSSNSYGGYGYAAYAPEGGPELNREKETLTQAQGKQILYALSFVRYMVTWHAVLNNFYRRGDEHETSAMGHPWTVFARWGVTAAPWLFIASGFLNTYAKLTGPKPEKEEDFVYAMVRRVATWYPLFIISLTWCALKVWSTRAEDWSHYMANVLLIHGVIWDESYFPFMLGDWWLSFLMIYFLTFSPMYGVLSTCANSVLWTMFTLAFVVAVPSAILEWHMFGDFPPFFLLQYWPLFIFGQALAVWFVRTCMQQRAAVVAKGSSHMTTVWVVRPVHEIPPLVRFGMTLSSLILGIMFFTFSPYDKLPLIRREVLPLMIKGGLAPLQGLMIVGLACEVDPMAKLLARKPFRWADKLVLTTFIFQVPVHNAVKDAFGWEGFTVAFVFALFIFSMLAYATVEMPWRRFLHVRAK